MPVPLSHNPFKRILESIQEIMFQIDSLVLYLQVRAGKVQLANVFHLTIIQSIQRQPHDSLLRLSRHLQRPIMVSSLRSRCVLLPLTLGLLTLTLFTLHLSYGPIRALSPLAPSPPPPPPPPPPDDKPQLKPHPLYKPKEDKPKPLHCPNTFR